MYIYIFFYDKIHADIMRLYLTNFENTSYSFKNVIVT